MCINYEAAAYAVLMSCHFSHSGAAPCCPFCALRVISQVAEPDKEMVITSDECLITYHFRCGSELLF
jgi:hypothetical protein